MQAKDIMTKKVVTLSPEMGITEASRILLRRNISGAPVVDKKGKIVGILTEADLISRDKNIHIPTALQLLGGVIYLSTVKGFENEFKRIASTKVSDLMVSRVVTVKPTDSIEDIATIMSEKRIHTLPVVSGNKIAGIIGKRDIVSAIAG